MPTKKKTRAPLGHYAKSLVAFAAPALTQLAVDLNRDGVTPTEVARNLVVALLTALVVWAVPNVPA